MKPNDLVNDLILEAIANVTRVRLSAEQEIAFHESHITALRYRIADGEERRKNLVATMRALELPIE